MARGRHSTANSLGATLVLGVALILFFPLKELFGDLVGTSFLEFVSRKCGLTAAQMTAVLLPYFIPATLSVALVWLAYKIAYVSLERSIFAEDPHASALSLMPMRVTDIAEYLLDESRWGWESYGRLNLKELTKGNVPGEMRRAGLAFEVRYIGTPPLPQPQQAVEIDRSYWHSATFDEYRIWDERNAVFTEDAGSRAFPMVLTYRFGSAPRVDVLRTWPKASLSFKAWTRAKVAMRIKWLHFQMPKRWQQFIEWMRRP